MTGRSENWGQDGVLQFPIEWLFTACVACLYLRCQRTTMRSEYESSTHGQRGDGVAINIHAAIDNPEPGHTLLSHRIKVEGSVSSITFMGRRRRGYGASNIGNQRQSKQLQGASEMNHDSDSGGDCLVAI
jgi:hypothetical protein